MSKIIFNANKMYIFFSVPNKCWHVSSTRCEDEGISKYFVFVNINISVLEANLLHDTEQPHIVMFSLIRKNKQKKPLKIKLFLVLFSQFHSNVTFQKFFLSSKQITKFFLLLLFFVNWLYLFYIIHKITSNITPNSITPMPFI